jgi:DNA polymerase (family 10)
MVRDQDDLTRFAGIGEAIARAIREIVTTGTLGKLEKLRAQVAPAVASITSHTRLDLKRVMRVYKKLEISSVDELRQGLESGEISARGWRSTSGKGLPRRTRCCCTGRMT